MIMKHGMIASVGSESPYWDPVLRPYIEYVIPWDFLELFEKKKRKGKRKQPFDQEKVNLWIIFDIYNTTRKYFIELFNTIKVAFFNLDDPIIIDVMFVNDIPELKLESYIVPNTNVVKDIVNMMANRINVMYNCMQQIAQTINSLKKESYEDLYAHIDRLFDEITQRELAK